LCAILIRQQNWHCYKGFIEKKKRCEGAVCFAPLVARRQLNRPNLSRVAPLLPAMPLRCAYIAEEGLWSLSPFHKKTSRKVDRDHNDYDLKL
jgi:hypothetical protein